MATDVPSNEKDDKRLTLDCGCSVIIDKEALSFDLCSTHKQDQLAGLEYVTTTLLGMFDEQAKETPSVHRPSTNVGTRVRVNGGDGVTPYGLGTYVGSAPVYFAVMPDGSLQSHPDARKEITSDDFPGHIRVERVPDNPVIRLDNGGQLVYGCQVWWEPVDQATGA